MAKKYIEPESLKELATAASGFRNARSVFSPESQYIYEIKKPFRDINLAYTYLFYVCLLLLFCCVPRYEVLNNVRLTFLWPMI